MNQQVQQIPVRFSDDDVKGRFASTVQVSHQPDHFVLDFFMAAPPSAQLVSRVIVTPSHLKRLAKVIDDQLKAYEQAFGKVDASKEISTIGFRTE